jgi:hypothetical protein
MIGKKVDRFAQPTPQPPLWNGLAVKPIGDFDQLGDVVHLPY